MSDAVQPEQSIDGATFRWVLGLYPTGVCVVTARKPGGTQSLEMVTAGPPLLFLRGAFGSVAGLEVDDAA